MFNRMSLKLTATRVALASSLLCLSLTAAAHQVIGIADGDTLTLLVNQRPLKIRLANIDAPEKKQAFGQRSRQSLSELCWKKNAKYEVQDIDRYKRTVAVVHCGGVNVNRLQVERGMAWVYPRYNKDMHLPALQDAAQRDGRGLWFDREPVPPWQWRRKK